jgi:hypothetical protein
MEAALLVAWCCLGLRGRLVAVSCMCGVVFVLVTSFKHMSYQSLVFMPCAEWVAVCYNVCCQDYGFIWCYM